MENLNERIGYACINMHLRETTNNQINRKLNKDTWKKPGAMKLASERALLNIKGLLEIVKWNEENNIKFYRMSSSMFPWWSRYKFESLQDWPEIKEILEEVGAFARKVNQRLSFHPSHFVVLGSQNPRVRNAARQDLEKHSQLLDIMGFEPSLWNKMNIHVGSAQGGKEQMMQDWVKSFNKLSENCRKRIAIENDDKPAMYSVQDLYSGIYEKTGVPITFDTLHHEVGSQGTLSMAEAATLAESTWPAGLFVIHHSSRKKIHEDESARYNQHADYIYEIIHTFGTDCWIMVESKGKEKSILEYMKNGPKQSILLHS